MIRTRPKPRLCTADTAQWAQFVIAWDDVDVDIKHPNWVTLPSIVIDEQIVSSNRSKFKLEWHRDQYFRRTSLENGFKFVICLM